jgi:enoyl-CoA hydratase
MVNSVQIETRDAVAIVRLLRPPANALDLATVVELADTFEALARDASQARALMLTGLPGCFSAGVDLKLVPAYGPDEQAGMVRAINRMALALYSFPRPTVAAVSGHAIAGGLVLVLCCDVRIVARGDYKLGLGEVAAGVPFPVGAMAVSRSELTPASARVLILGSQPVGPERALALGFVDAIEEIDRLESVALRECERLARFPADVYARTKEALRAEALARMRHVLAADDDPSLRAWLSKGTADAARRALKGSGD